MKDVYKYLVCNYPEIESHIMENMYIITINNDVIKTEEDLLVKNEGEIKIIPIVSGSAWWFVPILIGGGAAAVTAATTATSFLFVLGSALITTGVSMGIQGVTNLLFPQQTPQIGFSGLSETDSRVNYSFNGIQNVSRSGVCIPLIYGEVFCGSIVVSSGTDTAPVFAN